MDIDLKEQCEDLLLEMISNPCLLTAEHKAAVSVLKILTSHNEPDEDKVAEEGGETNLKPEDRDDEKQSRATVCSMSVNASDRYLAKLLKQPEVSIEVPHSVFKRDRYTVYVISTLCSLPMLNNQLFYVTNRYPARKHSTRYLH